MAKLAWPCRLHSMPATSVGMAPGMVSKLCGDGCQPALGEMPMYCFSCGARNPDDGPYCVRCGQVLVQVVPQPGVGSFEDSAAIRMLLPVGRSGWAIAAGYAGLFAVLAFPAPIALILGIIAIRDIKRHPEKHGIGRAIFGLVMGILGTLVLAGFLIALAVG